MSAKGEKIDDVFLRMVEDLEDWNDFLGENYVAGVLLLAIMNVSTQTHKLSANNALGKLTPTLFPHIPCLDLYCVSRVIKSDGSLVTKISKAIPWRMFLAPLVEYRGLFGDYLKKLSLARTRRAKDREPFIESCPKVVSLKDRVKDLEGLCDTLMILPKEIKSLKARIYKLETIINHKDSTSGKQCDLGDKYLSDQDGEPFFKYMGSTNPSANKDVVNDLVDALDDLVDELEAEKNRVAEQKRLRLQLMLEEANNRKSIDFSKSTHMKVAIERRGTNKRRYVDVHRPLIEEDTSKKFLSIDRLKMQNNVLDEFMIQMCLNLKPWKEDSLSGLDDERLGWLVDNHIELWVWYMWHFRQSFDDWSMRDVKQVFIPINEPKRHWSLAQFHIQSGNVTFYDSQKTYDLEFRPWYVKMRSCLESKLPVVLQQTGVFASKGIDPTRYSIKFTNAQNVPKQGGVFGNCGVFVYLFLYRLAHGIPLDVEDPIQTALAYREKMVQLFFEHKIIYPS
ncbi:phospholipase-like protein [Tanacetum coccineum]